MNPLNIHFAPELNTEFTCSCGNAILLQEGETCEICMGLVPGDSFDDGRRDPYDAFYFEDLEAYLDSMEQAA